MSKRLFLVIGLLSAAGCGGQPADTSLGVVRQPLGGTITASSNDEGGIVNVIGLPIGPIGGGGTIDGTPQPPPGSPPPPPAVPFQDMGLAGITRLKGWFGAGARAEIAVNPTSGYYELHVRQATRDTIDGQPPKAVTAEVTFIRASLILEEGELPFLAGGRLQAVDTGATSVVPHLVEDVLTQWHGFEGTLVAPSYFDLLCDPDPPPNTSPFCEEVLVEKHVAAGSNPGRSSACIILPPGFPQRQACDRNVAGSVYAQTHEDSLRSVAEFVANVGAVDLSYRDMGLALDGDEIEADPDETWCYITGVQITPADTWFGASAPRDYLDFPREIDVWLRPNAAGTKYVLRNFGNEEFAGAHIQCVSP